MDGLFKNPPDLPSPINSSGGFSNGSGRFPLSRKLQRKPNSPPRHRETHKSETFSSVSENSVDRYFGSFSVESERHVWDLLKKHPEFGDKGSLRLNRIRNNTKDVLPNDPLKMPINGGFTVYHSPRNNGTDSSRSGNALK